MNIGIVGLGLMGAIREADQRLARGNCGDLPDKPRAMVNATPLIIDAATPNGQESPPSVALDYWGRLRRRSHSPRAERIKVKPPSPPSAQSVQTKKKPPGDLAISP